jgi:WD40 repeat protein
MMSGGLYWMCGRHSPPEMIPVDKPGTDANGLPSTRFDRLPSVLAIPFGEYAHETHLVMRLHRLCDSVEILTRFSFIVELGELRKRLGNDPFPEPLARALRDQIERPTLGQWKNLLQVAAESLARTDPLVVPELREFVLGELIPGLERGPRSPKGKKKSDEPGLIDLRNNLVHGGAMTRLEAGRQLEAWEPWLYDRIERLDFLAKADLCYMTGGVARRMIGTDTEATTERPLPGDLRLALEGCDRHVVLIHQGRWVDLWPLCDYGRAERSTGKGSPKAKSDSPMVYIRAERDRLLYAALGADLSQSENREGGIVAQFQALFALKDHVKLDLRGAFDFEADLRRDSAALVGRVGEVENAIDILKRTQSGVLWLSGKGGIGKSFFTARLAMDPHLTGDSKKVCRIAWRFQASDQNRCNRVAFFRHAVTRLEEWLHDKKGFDATRDVGPLFTQLQGLLDEAATREAAPHPNARAPRVVFLLDGLDEIARGDPDFASVPFLLTRANVVWLCSGRPEGDLPCRFTPDRCTPVFPDGLPAMSDADIRGMLLQGSDRLKYDLLGLDREQAANDGTIVTNAAVEAVVARAAGLPLYVRYVIQDLLADEHRVDALDRLPSGLNAYYDELLKRLGIGELQAILTPLVATIAWARAPLDEETLLVLMSRRKLFLDPEKGRDLIRRALDASQAMLKLAPIPGTDRLGYEPYHPTLRDHIRADPARIIGQQNDLARDELCALVRDWDQLPPDHHALAYVLRHGPLTLIEESRWDDLATLWLDPDRGLLFHEAKAEAGMVFDLVRDFGEAVRHAPAGHSALRLVRLLGQALRCDAHFLTRHPTSVFQCLWNRGWWYDCDQAARYHRPPSNGWPCGGPPWEQPEPRLSTILSQWRRSKEQRLPGFFWVRSMRPLQSALGGPLQGIFQGHEHSVMSVAFDPEGRRIVSGSQDKTVRVWDTETGAQIARLNGHDGWVASVAFAPDGRRIVSGSIDKTVRVWDPETGAQVARLDDSHEGVVAVSFDLEGRRILSGTMYREVGIWDAETGSMIARFSRLSGPDYYVQRGPQGLRLVRGSNDGTAMIWDAEDYVELHRLFGEEAPVHRVAFDPHGRRIAAGFRDGTVVVWNAETGAKIAELDGHEGTVHSVAFAPDGRRIVSGSSDQTVRVWDASTGAPITRFDGHDGPVLAVAFAPDGRRIVSGSSDQMVRVWDAEAGAQISRLDGAEGPVSAVAFAPDGRRIVSGSDNGTVRVWDAEAGDRIAQIVGQEAPVQRMAFDPHGRRIAAGLRDGTVLVLDAETGAKITRFDGHQSAVDRIAFDAEARRISSGSEDGTVLVWDAETGALLARPDRHQGAVLSVAFEPDGRRIVSESRDKSLRVFDAETGAQIARLDGHACLAHRVASGADGRRIVSWTDEAGALQVRDGESGALVARFARNYHATSNVAFDPERRRIAGSEFGAWVRVWDAETNDLIIQLDGHDSRVECVAFDPEGRRIVSGSYDTTLRVWDSVTGAQIARLDGHQGPVSGVAFDPEGRRIVSRSEDRTVRVWDAETGAQIAQLDDQSGRVLGGARDAKGRRVVRALDAAESVRAWDVDSGECQDVILEAADIRVIAAGATIPPFGASRRGPETALTASAGGVELAWFPEAIVEPSTPLTAPIWAWFNSNHIFLIRLEGMH